MYIKYDKHELLELFESEPVYIPYEETGMCIYRREADNGVEITLYLSIYENKCSIGLGLHGDGIFEVSLDNVEYLRAEDNGLRIHQKDSTSDYVIYFKPNLFIKVLGVTKETE